MKIAIFGGAFNPVHKGHVEIAKDCAKATGCDELLIVPSKLSPHKNNDALIEDFHRIKMCELAFDNIKNCKVSNIETNREGLSYTVDTLEELKKIYPNDELVLICGSDMFLSLLTWRNPKKIFQLASICAFLRDKQDMQSMVNYKTEIENVGAKVLLTDFVIPPFSSTQIRENIKLGKDAKSMLDVKVYDYILKNKLYE